MKYTHHIYAIVLFAASNVHPMELAIKSENYCQQPINPGVFNENSKEYMQKCINLWVESAKQGNIDQNSGLAGVWKNLSQESINNIINDQHSLKQANELLLNLVSSETYKALPGIDAISQLNLTGAYFLAAQMTRVVIQSTILSAVMKKCSQFKDISANDHLNAFALIGEDSIPYNIKFLQCNQTLDTTNFMPIGTGMLLLYTYLQQQHS